MIYEGDKCFGPTALALEAIHQIGWNIATEDTFKLQVTEQFHVHSLDTSWGLLKHLYREFIRRAVWLSIKRKDMNGIGIIGTEATLKLLKTVGPDEKGFLRTILCGGVPTQSVAFKQGKALSEECPFCGEEKEDKQHRWHSCKKWTDLREKRRNANSKGKGKYIQHLWHLHSKR